MNQTLRIFKGCIGRCALSALVLTLTACGGAGSSADPVSLVQPPPAQTAHLSVNMVGTGGVTSSPANISCGGGNTACAADFTVGTSVTLKAAPATAFQFSGWDGSAGDVDCAGTGDCTVMLDHAKTVKATFSAKVATSYGLTVNLAGSGTVSADVAGLGCTTSSCAGSFAANSSVTLSAAAAPNFSFTGWSGSGISCPGTGSCAVPMSAARSLTATFTLVPAKTFALNVSLVGSGKVGSTPAGIDCGSACSQTYADGSTVKLAAVPATGFAFTGWTHACGGTNGCDLTMSAARQVTATFTAIPAATVALNAVVNGSGVLTSSPAGINCPTSCATTLASGSTVVLTAAPAAGQRLSGWAGACTGTATSATTCTLNLTATTSVAVSFVPITYTLSVTTQGSGTVVSTPAGISCGTSCSTAVNQGGVVSLSAQPAAGQVFSNWGGACSGSVSPCSVTLSAAKSVSAVFTAATTSGNYNCADANVRCVDDTAGATQEYSTIQAAASAAKPGDTVVVYSGSYAGFAVSTSGTSAQPIRFVANSSDVVINKGGNTENDAIHLSNVSYVTIEGFTIRNDTASSPRVHRCISAREATPEQPMRGNVLRNNRCTASEAEGFYVSEFADGLIEGNTISGSGTNGQTRMHGIYLANAGSNNTTIRGNTIFGNANAESNGIHANGDLSVGGNGLIRNIVIEGNTIYGNGQNGLNFDGVQDSLIQNNLVYGNARHALRDYMIDAAAGAARMRIVNNTFVATNGWAIKLSDDAGGHVIFNNILFGSTGSLSVGSTSLSSDANVVGGSFSSDDEASTIALDAWRTRTGQDGHSLTSTQSAVFANAGASNFALASASPARDKGLPGLAGITAPLKDLLGLSHALGIGIDIGAIESAP